MVRVQVDTAGQFAQLDIGERRASLRMEGRRLAAFRVRRVEVLTRGRAEAVATEAAESADPVLVVFERSSPDGRALLRERELSYAAKDGELFLFAPPVYVERPAHRRATVGSGSAPAPFALRASRVPRWLLLHTGESPSVRELSREVSLSEAMVSRTIHALAEDALLEVATDPRDARVRRARVRDAGALLDAFERATAARRVRRVTWDLGVTDATAALEAWREAADRVSAPYAVSGIAGATFVRRVVEPAQVTVWIDRADVDAWAEDLMASPARPGPGRITAQVAPDPFILSTASERDGVRVADAVQLYLDCRLAGERALEAADAIREEMRW